MTKQSFRCSFCQANNEVPAQFCLQCGEPLLIGRCAGAYRLTEPLGTGGMGMVFRAEHVRLGTPFAVKLLHRKLAQNQKVAARFLREAKATSTLRHEHIVFLADFGDMEPFGPYIAMEYLQGQSLSKTPQHGGVSLSDMFLIGVQICDAMHYSHQQGMIHRDLKPDNIFMMEREKGQPLFLKILDFGIAKIMQEESEELTKTGAVLGTPTYMAPEQGLGQDIDHRVDVYALCTILYQLCAGRPPFVGETVVEILSQRLYREAPLLSSFVPHFRDTQIERLLARGLHRDRQFRIASMKELREGLVQAELELAQHWSSEQRNHRPFHDIVPILGRIFPVATAHNNQPPQPAVNPTTPASMAEPAAMPTASSQEGMVSGLEGTKIPGSSEVLPASHSVHIHAPSNHTDYSVVSADSASALDQPPKDETLLLSQHDVDNYDFAPPSFKRWLLGMGMFLLFAFLVIWVQRVFFLRPTGSSSPIEINHDNLLTPHINRNAAFLSPEKRTSVGSMQPEVPDAPRLRNSSSEQMGSGVTKASDSVPRQKDTVPTKVRSRYNKTVAQRISVPSIPAKRRNVRKVAQLSVQKEPLLRREPTPVKRRRLATPQDGCPADDASTRWIRIYGPSDRVEVRVAGRLVRYQPTARGWCVALRGQPVAVQIDGTTQNLALCEFQVRSTSQRTLTVRLKDAEDQDPGAYCVKGLR